MDSRSWFRRKAKWIVSAALFLLIFLCSPYAKYDLKPHLSMTGGELLQIQERGSDVLMRECTAQEKEQILKWAETVPSVGFFQLSFIGYVPGVVVHSDRWTVNFTGGLVVLNCCPNDDGSLTQVAWDMRDEDLLLRTYLTKSLGRDWVQWW